MAGEGQKYVALLRGINVGGHGITKMADLRAQFEALGLKNVATHIQSGNVLFTTTETDAECLADRLATQLASSLGYKGPVFLLSHAQLVEAIANNPFEPERLGDEQACHLMFLSREPDQRRREALLALQGDQYRFAIHGKVLYYAYSRVFEGRRRTVNFEKVLGVAGTARNWRVVAKLLQLAG